jgi:flagellar basal-body rod protein FlgB
MADFKIFVRSFAVLQKSLDLRQAKQQVIASNVANAETPGYEARKLDFEADLRKAIDEPALPGRQTHAKHIPVGANGIGNVQGTLTREKDRDPLGDGNSVSVDDEMLDLAENQLLYEAGAQILKRKLALLKYAANDGR